MAARPTFYSLEMHLAVMLREIARVAPSLVVLDPISAFMESGERMEVQSMLLRIVDYLKGRGITGVFTHLMPRRRASIATDAGLSSLMDAWILLLNREVSGEFNRELYLLKARGIPHSNQVREFVMSADGIPAAALSRRYGALTGSARKQEEARDPPRRVRAASNVDAAAPADRTAPPQGQGADGGARGRPRGRRDRAVVAGRRRSRNSRPRSSGTARN